MAKQIIILAVVAMLSASAVSALGPYGLGLEGLGAAVPAAAANLEAGKATGHAIAAENRATEAAIDRATGNPIGAAINENRAVAHSAASSMAAGRSAVDATYAGGLGGSGLAAASAGAAANAATRTAAGAIGAAPYGWAPGYYGGAYPGAYGAAYGYPYGGAYPGFLGPYGYGAGSIAYRGIGLRDYLMNDPALRMQREVSRTRVYW